DACRNNPLAERLRMTSGRTRDIGNTRGLARIDKTQGMVVAYATASDNVAMDGKGRNSPFTTALIRRLREPGLEIEIMFRRIAADVNAATGGQQRPETYISLLSEYYINQTDRDAWDKIKDDLTADKLREFTRLYPTSALYPRAQQLLANIEQAGREREETKFLQQQVAQEIERQLKARQKAEDAERARQEQLAKQQAEAAERARQEQLAKQQAEAAERT